MKLRGKPTFQFHPFPKNNMKSKHEIIDKILANKTYMPESSMYISLAHALERLALSDLKNLKIVLDIQKCDHAVETNE